MIYYLPLIFDNISFKPLIVFLFFVVISMITEKFF